MAPQPKPKKRWRKKTPEEIVLAQEERIRTEVEKLEAELAEKRRLLDKFEQARAIFKE